MTMFDIIDRINELSMGGNHQFGQLQRLREKRYKKRPQSWKPFVRRPFFEDEGYAYHSGGMPELQFNISEIETNNNCKAFRYGIAFSFIPGQSVPDPVAKLKPVVEIFNEFIKHNPTFFNGYEMLIWTGGKNYQHNPKVIQIKDDLIKRGNFVFIGKLIHKTQNNINNLDIEIIVNTFDYLFPVYRECLFGKHCIDAKFNFYPVGHGGFYSGRISDADNDCFTFVYDCGTQRPMKYLYKEIKCFKKGLDNKKLDLLMISHFHFDHVSGVKKLLENIHCKKLIIPYYNPAERLLLGVTEKAGDEEYFKLLRDPIGYFSNKSFNIDEIIVIDSNKNYQEFEDAKLLPDVINEEYSATQKRKIESEESIGPFDNKVKIVSGYAPWVFYGMWEFVFYYNEMDSKIIAKFIKDVDSLWRLPKNSISDLLNDVGIRKLRKMYDNHIVKNFKDVEKNINNTSLVVYHGPFSISHRNNYSCNCNSSSCVIFAVQQNYCSTLLTGDISLKDKLTVDDILKHLGSKNINVMIFQIPHHGSIENWPFDFPNKFSACCNYVVAHRLKDKYHPSIEVLDDIMDRLKGNIQLVNEFSAFEYRISALKK